MAKSKLPVCFVSGAIGQRRDIYSVDVVKALSAAAALSGVRTSAMRRANDDRRRLVGLALVVLVSSRLGRSSVDPPGRRQVRPTYLRLNRFFVFVREPEVRRCFFAVLRGGEADETNQEMQRSPVVGVCALCNVHA